MFYLIWEMGLLLFLAFAGGLATGWLIWSSKGRSAEADEALAKVTSLSRENENLARRLGEAEARAGAAETRSLQPAKTGHSTPLPTGESENENVVAPPPVDAADDLTRIKGLGPKAAASLKAGGVTRIAQIADWSTSDVEIWDEKINGRGRIIRDDWVAQARALARP